MGHTISEKTVDLAGKTRVWVTASTGDYLMFKFDHDPTDEEVYIEVTNILAVMYPVPEP